MTRSSIYTVYKLFKLSFYVSRFYSHGRSLVFQKMKSTLHNLRRIIKLYTVVMFVVFPDHHKTLLDTNKHQYHTYSIAI